MAMRAQASELMTAEELLALDLPGKTAELVRGRLVVREPPGYYHGKVAMKLGIRIGVFVEANGLGEVLAQDTGFKLASNPDTVRAPDVAFLRRERVPEPAPRGYGMLAPDLAVEVVSPNDRAGELLTKVGDWLDAGVRLVWVIDPDRRQARIHRADGSVAIVDGDGLLEGEDVLPGFSCALGAVLE